MDEEVDCVQNGLSTPTDNINGVRPSTIHLERHLFKLNETFKMITLIQNHPLIWDRSHSEYSSGLSRALAFEQVASKLNIPVDDVRWKWQILRKEYFKKIAIRKRNHAVGIISRPWKWSKALSFLDKMREPAENLTENGCIVKKSPKNDYSLLASPQQITDPDNNDSKDLQLQSNNSNTQEVIELDDYEDAAKFFCETVYSPAHSNDDNDDDDHDDNESGGGKKPASEAKVSERKPPQKLEAAKRQIIDLEKETNGGTIFDFNFPNKKPANFHPIRHVITNGSGVLKNVRVHRIHTKGSIINTGQNPQNSNKEQAPPPSSSSLSSITNGNTNNNGTPGEQPDKTMIKSIMEFLKVQNQILLDKSQKEDILLQQLLDKNKEMLAIQEREQKSLLKQQDPFYAYTMAKLPLLEDLPRTPKWLDKFQTIIDQACRTLFDEYQKSIETSSEEKKSSVDKSSFYRSNRKR